MYTPNLLPQLETIPIRGCNYAGRVWDSANNSGGIAKDGHGPKRNVFLLHGWMDAAASWQFTVDSIVKNHVDFFANSRLIAPDWRGFGQSRIESYAGSFF